jgi:hypothetical protein
MTSNSLYLETYYGDLQPKRSTLKKLWASFQQQVTLAKVTK